MTILFLSNGAQVMKRFSEYRQGLTPSALIAKLTIQLNHRVGLEPWRVRCQH